MIPASAPPPNVRATGDAGFTLIELVAVLAIFALVATMGLTALSAAVRQRDRLAETAAANGALTLMLALLRADLDAAVPILFHPPDANPESAFSAPTEGGLTAVSVGGQWTFDAEESAGFARVVWRHDAAARTLTRQSWPVMAPLRADAAGPEVAVLNGVIGFKAFSFVSAGGWVEGDGTIPGSYTSSLPLAIDIRIETERFGSLRLVSALK